jgi:hypothetical protein
MVDRAKKGRSTGVVYYNSEIFYKGNVSNNYDRVKIGLRSLHLPFNIAISGLINRFNLCTEEVRSSFRVYRTCPSVVQALSTPLLLRRSISKLKVGGGGCEILSDVISLGAGHFFSTGTYRWARGWWTWF